jgi:isopenicillin-N epimerase
VTFRPAPLLLRALVMDRRRFLRTGLVLASGGVAAACGSPAVEAHREGSGASPRTGRGVLGRLFGSNPDWGEVRREFDLAEDQVQLGALYIASHPRTVREAIEEYRHGIDRQPVIYLDAENRRRRQETLRVAERYLGVAGEEIALTDSTTMGIGLVYGGLRLRGGQEILTTEHDYFVTHEAARLAAARTGASVRHVRLFDDAATVSADEIVDRARRALRPATRVLGLTWVHSSTGMKLPLGPIARAVRQATRDRNEDDRVLIVIDGVHGLGVEDVTLDELGCDFFAAGCHKWLFGPRGTGVLWGRRAAWTATRPTIPSFIDDVTWTAWLRGEEPRGPNTAAQMTPGGFKAFEHQWAMTEAFEFHQAIGKTAVARRTHALARQLKEGLAGMDHVTLRTPMADELSAGIVCFDIDGLDAPAAVERLRERGIVGTVTPYAVVHARLATAIYNTPEEIERALGAVRALA